MRPPVRAVLGAAALLGVASLVTAQQPQPSWPPFSEPPAEQLAPQSYPHPAPPPALQPVLPMEPSSTSGPYWLSTVLYALLFIAREVSVSLERRQQAALADAAAERALRAANSAIRRAAHPTDPPPGGTIPT